MFFDGVIPFSSSINDLGQVAFFRQPANPLAIEEIVRHDSNTTTSIFENLATGDAFDFADPLFTMNNSGEVAFGLFFDPRPPNQAIVKSDGTGMIIIADDTSQFSQLGTTPALNNSGQVVFAAFETDGTNGIYVGDNPGNVTKLVDFSVVDPGNPGFIVEASSFNDQGTVAFVSQGIGPFPSKLFTSDGTNTVFIADTSGAFTSLGVLRASLNNNNQIVFEAGLGPGRSGLFFGPDANKDKLIASGDMLNGKIVDDIFFIREGFNNNGQVAFRTVFEDGTTGVYRADPVIPEPASLSLFGLGLMGILGFKRRAKS